MTRDVCQQYVQARGKAGRRNAVCIRKALTGPLQAPGRAAELILAQAGNGRAQRPQAHMLRLEREAPKLVVGQLHLDGGKGGHDGSGLASVVAERDLMVNAGFVTLNPLILALRDVYLSWHFWLREA